MFSNVCLKVFHIESMSLLVVVGWSFPFSRRISAVKSFRRCSEEVTSFTDTVKKNVHTTMHWNRTIQERHPAACRGETILVLLSDNDGIGPVQANSFWEMMRKADVCPFFYNIT